MSYVLLMRSGLRGLNHLQGVLDTQTQDFDNYCYDLLFLYRDKKKKKIICLAFLWTKVR